MSEMLTMGVFKFFESLIDVDIDIDEKTGKIGGKEEDFVVGGDLQHAEFFSRQLAGSALNLNPHLHILFCDGVFAGGGETFRFRNLEAITDKEVEKILTDISSKVVKLLKKQGYIDHEGEMINHPLSDSLFQDHES